MKPTLANLERLARARGGTVESDGCGGYEVLAPPGRRWVDGEVQCLVLPLSECESSEEKTARIQECIDLIENGHEPY